MDWLKEKLRPKHRYLYKMLCRHCDLFWERLDETDNKCPGCDRPMEIYEVFDLPKEQD